MQAGVERLQDEPSERHFHSSSRERKGEGVVRKKLSPSLNLPLSHHPLAGRRLAHPGCRGLPLSAPPCGPVARAPRVQRPSSFRPSLRAGGSRTQDAEAFLSPPLPAGRWPAHPGCRGLPLSAPLCGPVARAPRVQRPSSLRPSLRAGGPRTQDAEAFLFPPLPAGRWPAHPGIHIDKSAASAYSNVACWQRLRRV